MEGGEEMSDKYEARGFSNRIEYLEDLADQAGVSIELVMSLADMLGPEEDFDGLVNEVEDFAFVAGGSL